MSSADIANIVVIGGGVIGTAIAAEISRHYDGVFPLEAAPHLGMGTSTRSSGVIHAGIYYNPGSLKAFHCLRGAAMLYEFCAAHNIPHERTGKLIVADSEDQLPVLQGLKRRGDENGVEGLEIVDGEFIRRLEPNIISPVALNSPNTGIVDAEALIKTFERIAKSNGAHILTNTRMIAAEAGDGPALIRTERQEFGA